MRILNAKEFFFVTVPYQYVTVEIVRYKRSYRQLGHVETL